MKTTTALWLFCAALACGSVACDPESGAVDPPADVCSSEGTGTVVVDVLGLPAGVNGAVTVDAPAAADRTVTVRTTLDAAEAGNYVVTASANVVAPDPVVRTVYQAAVTGGEFCLAADASQTTTVQYTPIPTSNRLWVTQSNSTAGQLAAVPSTDLRASGAAASTAAFQGPAGRSGAFDRDGNLWSGGQTPDGANVQRFAASALAVAGTAAADRALTVDFGGCVPAIGDLAFDPSGNLWIASPCDDSVNRIPAASLAATGSPVADVKLSGAITDGTAGIAFDAAGNLYVGSGAKLLRYDAARLSASSTEAPSRSFTVQREGQGPLAPDSIAFDAAGNAWVTDFAGNAIVKLTAEQLAGSADVLQPSVSIVLAVNVLLTSIAFDDGGGLWVPYAAGSIGRIDPSQLGTSSTAGAPTTPDTVVTSASFGALEWLGFYPAPAGLPLYAHLP